IRELREAPARAARHRGEERRTPPGRRASQVEKDRGRQPRQGALLAAMNSLGVAKSAFCRPLTRAVGLRVAESAVSRVSRSLPDRNGGSPPARRLWGLPVPWSPPQRST